MNCVESRRVGVEGGPIDTKVFGNKCNWGLAVMPSLREFFLHELTFESMITSGIMKKMIRGITFPNYNSNNKLYLTLTWFVINGSCRRRTQVTKKIA